MVSSVVLPLVSYSVRPPSREFEAARSPLDPSVSREFGGAMAGDASPAPEIPTRSQHWAGPLSKDMMETRMNFVPLSAPFPVQHRSLTLDVKGNKTDIVISKYEDSFLVIVTQIGCMGTILAAKSQDMISRRYSLYWTKLLLILQHWS
ncbi:hypothetical protein GUJ93_ZPchr0384g16416 [Zizania palustris]|uniref:Proteasome assembly chaperone 3 n=1 Tax=Zizania palustris TaxID=103762 RepID=A0A8J5RS07_ZIZPA|nr:hypothetical protein GUJ93_ZPchr0384g16416 [Zizania palustris]